MQASPSSRCASLGPRRRRRPNGRCTLMRPCIVTRLSTGSEAGGHREAAPSLRPAGAPPRRLSACAAALPRADRASGTRVGPSRARAALTVLQVPTATSGSAVAPTSGSRPAVPGSIGATGSDAISQGSKSGGAARAAALPGAARGQSPSTSVRSAGEAVHVCSSCRTAIGKPGREWRQVEPRNVVARGQAAAVVRPSSPGNPLECRDERPAAQHHAGDLCRPESRIGKRCREPGEEEHLEQKP